MLPCFTFQLISQQNHLSNDLAIDHLKKKSFFFDSPIPFRVCYIQRFHESLFLCTQTSTVHVPIVPFLGNFLCFSFRPLIVAFMTWALDALAAPVNFISWVN